MGSGPRLAGGITPASAGHGRGRATFALDVPRGDAGYSGAGQRDLRLANTGSGSAGTILHSRGANPLGDAIPDDGPGADTRRSLALTGAGANIHRAGGAGIAAGGTAGPAHGVQRRSVSADVAGTVVAYGGGTSDGGRGPASMPGELYVSIRSSDPGTGGAGSIMHERGANPLGSGLPDDRPGVAGRAWPTGGSAGAIRDGHDLRLGASAAAVNRPGRRAGSGYAEAPSRRIAFAANGANSASEGDPSRLERSLARTAGFGGRGANPLGGAIPDDRPGAGSGEWSVGNTPRPNIRRGDGGLSLGRSGVAAAPLGRGRTARSADTPKGELGYSAGDGRAVQYAAVGLSGSRGGPGSILRGRAASPLGDGLPADRPGVAPGSAGGVNAASGDVAASEGIGKLRHGGGPRLGAALSHPELPGRPGRARGADRPGAGDRVFVSAAGTTAEGDIVQEGPGARYAAARYGNVGRIIRDAVGVPGRGALFQTRPTDGTDGPVHIVYTMDVSKSMLDGNKILKAKEELKRAIGELRPVDSFNVIAFTRETQTFRDDAVAATPENVRDACEYVEGMKIGPGTNISGAMDLALKMTGIEYIYVASDGEPNGGIEDFKKLRKFIRERNTRNIRITTLALGLGEKFQGMKLLKAVAEENGGTYDYIDMSKLPKPKAAAR